MFYNMITIYSVYPIFTSQVMLNFLQSSLVLSFHIDKLGAFYKNAHNSTLKASECDLDENVCLIPRFWMSIILSLSPEKPLP